VPVNVAVTSLSDERGLRAAMVGVDTIFHLASGEWRGPSASLMDIDIQGTRALIQAAEDAGVERIFYVSHLGADRASAYPVLKAKGIAEEFIRRSSLTYTIFRTGVVFGPNDGFTTGLARVMAATPLVFLVPGDGSVQLQPIWVEDLVTCLTWCMDDPETYNRIFDIGGPEYLSFRQIAEMVRLETGLKRILINFPFPYLRGLTILLEYLLPNLPVSIYWLDYMAVNRTTALDTLPRVFNLMPSRMATHLAYLQGQSWGHSFRRRLIGKMG
jgi:NADH dehydrogenase